MKEFTYFKRAIQKYLMKRRGKRDKRIFINVSAVQRVSVLVK